jgi:hypothetical protein
MRRSTMRRATELVVVNCPGSAPVVAPVAQVAIDGIVPCRRRKPKPVQPEDRSVTPAPWSLRELAPAIGAELAARLQHELAALELPEGTELVHVEAERFDEKAVGIALVIHINGKRWRRAQQQRGVFLRRRF